MERYDKDLTGIVIVEDDEEDFLLAHDLLDQAFPERKNERPPLWMKNGQEVLDFLRRREGPGRPPLLVLLDVHLPRKDGMEVLEEIKAKPEFSHVSVVVFTGLKDEEVQERFAALGVEVIQKPASAKELQLAKEQLRAAWSRAVAAAR